MIVTLKLQILQRESTVQFYSLWQVIKLTVCRKLPNVAVKWRPDSLKLLFFFLSLSRQMLK
jgi:hypothetical protein